MRFTEDLKARVSKAQKKIVLPETNSRRVLKAAERVLADGFAKIVLVGKLEQIKKDAAKFQIDLTGVEVVDPETYYRMDELCAYFAKRREKKGMTLEKARESCSTTTPSSQLASLLSVKLTAAYPVLLRLLLKLSALAFRSSAPVLATKPYLPLSFS